MRISDWSSVVCSSDLTDAVFRLLRNASVLQPADPNLVVCWGGHSIYRDEYQYTKDVGYELGLRGLDIYTGCGPGAMKGPMTGATTAHAKRSDKRPGGKAWVRTTRSRWYPNAEK